MGFLSMNVVVSAIVDPWVTTLSFVVALAMRIQGHISVSNRPTVTIYSRFFFYPRLLDAAMSVAYASGSKNDCLSNSYRKNNPRFGSESGASAVFYSSISLVACHVWRTWRYSTVRYGLLSECFRRSDFYFHSMNAFVRCMSLCVITYHLMSSRSNQSRIRRWFVSVGMMISHFPPIPVKEKPVQPLPASPVGIVASGFANAFLLRIGAQQGRAV